MEIRIGLRGRDRVNGIYTDMVTSANKNKAHH